jgi:PIN domain nuclease of toxin-antitoxin system
MDLLLDTHALFWSIYNTGNLSAAAAAALDDNQNTVWATLTSAQEIADRSASAAGRRLWTYS